MRLNQEKNRNIKQGRGMVIREKKSVIDDCTMRKRRETEPAKIIPYIYMRFQ